MLEVYSAKMKSGQLSLEEARNAAWLCKGYGKRLGREDFCSRVDLRARVALPLEP